MDDNFQALGDVAAGVAGRIAVLRPASRDEWLENRKSTVGASEISALLGVSPYMTPYELWAIKSGLYVKEFAEAEFEDNAVHFPPTERGNLFEDDAIEMLRRLRPAWDISLNQIPGGVTFVDRENRMSSTPDAFAVEPGRSGRAAIQVKTMNDEMFRKFWLVDGAVQPPVGVAVQAITDATFADCERAYAAAMVAGFWRTSLYLIEVPLHARLMVKARELVKDFWARVAENRPYDPDFARDGAVIAKLFAEDNGGQIDLSGDNRAVELLDTRAVLKAREADGIAAAKDRKVIDSELIAKLQNAARGTLADGRMISATTVRRKGYSVEPSQYRQIKVKG